MGESYVWWKHGVIYQIYPRSFMDCNGDGIGDLAGITSRLDYIAQLGVDAIWISPCFPSPMKDFGYDVSNYIDIHPIFGTLADFNHLLVEAHARNLRVLLDFVPNHTSVQHPWFIESRSSRDNPKHDWYIWKDPKPDGSEPNNWESFFGGKAWQWDPNRQQYYLHLFLKEQPDLNWYHPEVVQAMHDVLRFWLEKGVDGFRIDAIAGCAKHPDFPDNPLAPPGNWFEAVGLKTVPIYCFDRPEIHEIVRGFRRVINAYGPQRAILGETGIFDPVQLMKYYGENLDELNIPLNFTPLMLPWNAAALKTTLAAYYKLLPKGGVANFFFDNHDFPRLATRLGWDNHRSVILLLLTLKGVPILYYGTELGMENVPVPLDRRQDPANISLSPGAAGRDPERTPMQWDASENAGFAPAGVQTWLPIAANYAAVNVAEQDQQPDSTLNLTRHLLELRRRLPALNQGDISFIEQLPNGILAFIRNTGDQKVLVVINFNESESMVSLPIAGKSGTILLSTERSLTSFVQLDALQLVGREGMLIQVG